MMRSCGRWRVGRGQLKFYAVVAQELIFHATSPPRVAAFCGGWLVSNDRRLIKIGDVDTLAVYNPDLLDDEGHCTALFVLDVQNLEMKRQFVSDMDWHVVFKSLLSMQQAADVYAEFAIQCIGFCRTHHLQTEEICRGNWNVAKAGVHCRVDIPVDRIGLADRVHKCATLCCLDLHGRWRPNVTDVGLVDFLHRDIPAGGVCGETAASASLSAEAAADGTGCIGHFARSCNYYG
jgi:hypothetical protein